MTTPPHGNAPDPSTVSALLAEGAAILGASGGLAMRARIRAAWPGATVAGPAFTARPPG